MAHEKRFARIPMSKSMRGICKEEDYAFLNNLGKTEHCQEESTFQESEWSERREERIQRRLEREKEERERLEDLERQKKEKEEQWRNHVAELANDRAALKQRADRLREFRELQRKVLAEDLGLNPSSAGEEISQFLMRI